MSDEADELVPPKLRVLFAVLRCAPWTEIKSASACAGFLATGVGLALAATLKVPVDHEALDAWLAFLAGAWGIAMAGQGWKQSIAQKTAAAAQKADP